MLPRPVPFSGATHASGTHPSDLVIVPYIAPVLLICLGGVAYAIVVFLLRHVYLSGVYEPLWASGRLAATAADNLLVLCDDSSAMAGNIQKVSTLTLGAIRRSADPAATWTKTLMKISSGNRVARS